MTESVSFLVSVTWIFFWIRSSRRVRTSFSAIARSCNEERVENHNLDSVKPPTGVLNEEQHVVGGDDQKVSLYVGKTKNIRALASEESLSFVVSNLLFKSSISWSSLATIIL